MAEPGRDIQKYVDAAMYDAQPILREEGVRVTPRVFLLDGPSDPLGTLAADWRMYRGDPVYSLDEITDDLRHTAWEDFSKTVLNTPLEGIQLKFMIEAVTRSFTHQMVRQRVGAYYVQESLRFAVKKGLAKEIALPPSIMDLSTANPEALHNPEGWEAAEVWANTVAEIETAYEKLISLGIPAEDARGLLPHAVTTRIIYCTNLRSLFENAGKRLCTQAQFEWRLVFLGIMQAIRKHQTVYRTTVQETWGPQITARSAKWQWELIAQPAPMTFAPVCYKEGKCGFMASLDRGCNIRPRVEQFAARGIPSSEWANDHHEPFTGRVVEGTGGERIEGGEVIYGIQPEEWMADPTAGWTTEDNRPQ